MIGGLKPYRAYVESGVDWLGEVPAHWTVQRLKSSTTNVVELDTERRRDDKYVALEHVESWTGQLLGASHESPLDSQLKRFRLDDILFGKLRPYLAKVTRLQTGGLCVGEFLVLRPNRARLSASYAERLLRSKPIVDAVDSSTFGAKMPRADWHFIGSMRIVYPPLSEQAAIVRFLDHADLRIRRYIRAKEKLIALLEEQKQAIIHQAVTGRIDVRTGQPYTAYKPSGVEWLGDVPVQWDISRVKTEFQCLNHRRLPLSGTERGAMTMREYDYYGASGIIDQVDDYLFDDELLLIAEDGANLVLRNLPLAIIARGKFWVNNHAHILKPRRGRLEFLADLMEGLNYLPWISGAAQPKLTQDRLLSIAIAVPPRDEQDRIVSYVSAETRHPTVVIARARNEIELLREFRTRLIADVVTGKLDVREAAAALPEVDPLVDDDEAEYPLDAGYASAFDDDQELAEVVV